MSKIHGEKNKEKKVVNIDGNEEKEGGTLNKKDKENKEGKEEKEINNAEHSKLVSFLN